MKSFFRNLSSRFPFFANRPSALERAVRQSPKSRRLRMEPLENRALLAVDAFGGALADVGESWGPDPAPAAFSASELSTDAAETTISLAALNALPYGPYDAAAVIDVSGVNTTLADALFSVQNETPEPVAPPSFEQLMEALGQVKIESLDDEFDAASSSCLDEAESATQLLNSLNLQDISQGTPRQVVFYDSSDADFDASTLNLDDESVYYVDVASANGAAAESYSATPRSGGGSNSGGSTSVVPSDYQFTTYGSTTIFESATYNSSGGSNQGPFLGFTVPAIPSGYAAFVRFGSSSNTESDGVYAHDYYVVSANITDGNVTPLHSNYYPNPSGGYYDMYVSGGTSYCVIPISDTVNESCEGFQATLFLVNTQSGGADYDPTPIACGSINVIILDDGVEYYYKTFASATSPTREAPPAEDEGDAQEWTKLDFVEHYVCRRGTTIPLDTVNLQDDYQRAIFHGDNLLKWEVMERNVQAVVVDSLLIGNLNLPSYEQSVARNVTNYDDLYVYGNGYTDVVARSTATLQEETEEIDEFGLKHSIKTYKVDVIYHCEVNDKFADPLDINMEFGLPYDLTGAWSTTGSYEVTVIKIRYEVDN